MPVWNKPHQLRKPTLSKETYQQAELYRFKLQVEDEIKANPLAELAKQVTRPFVAKEPEIPP